MAHTTDGHSDLETELAQLANSVKILCTLKILSYLTLQLSPTFCPYKIQNIQNINKFVSLKNTKDTIYIKYKALNTDVTPLPIFLSNNGTIVLQGTKVEEVTCIRIFVPHTLLLSTSVKLRCLIHHGTPDRDGGRFCDDQNSWKVQRTLTNLYDAHCSALQFVINHLA